MAPTDDLRGRALVAEPAAEAAPAATPTTTAKIGPRRGPGLLLRRTGHHRLALSVVAWRAVCFWARGELAEPDAEDGLGGGEETASRPIRSET